MEIDITKLKEITDAFDTIDFYYEDLSEYNFYSSVAKSFKNNYKGTEEYYVENGATKGVFIFPKLNYVIKVPFNHTDYDEELYGADADNRWDYCEAEVNKYKQAQKEGLEQFFAKTTCVYRTVDSDYPIYLQELAEIYDQDFSRGDRYSIEEKDSIREKCSSGGYSCFNAVWLSDVFNFYGEEMFYRLLNFIDDADIRDLHNSNVGYIGMRPVLVDYSSYND